jgi:hypothetical protein
MLLNAHKDLLALKAELEEKKIEVANMKQQLQIAQQ